MNIQKLRSVLFYLVPFFMLCKTTSSQVSLEWSSIYNATNNIDDLQQSMVVDSSGNIFVTGSSQSALNGLDFLTIKYNSSGVLQWAARYNGPYNTSEFPCSIALDGFGNVYVFGSGFGVEPRLDYVTVKYSSAGIFQWAVRYNGPEYDRAESMAVDNLGNVYVTGYSEYDTIQVSECATVMYNSNGMQQWIAIYGGPEKETAHSNSIALDEEHNVYIAGSSLDTTIKYLTVKYNSAGVQQWAAKYSSPNSYGEYARFISLDDFGSVFVTGESVLSSENLSTIKFNSSGILQWAQSYHAGRVNSLVIGRRNNIYISGFTYGNEVDFLTIKYNQEGQQQWVSRYNGAGNSVDEAFSMDVDSIENVYVIGKSWGGSNFMDYAIIKYDSLGNQKWVTSYDNNVGHDYGNSICLSRSGNIYVSGSTSPDNFHFDFLTLKYSQSTGIQQISSNIPDQFSLSQNYPNPFNPTTKIKFDILKYSNVRLYVFDIIGRVVQVLLNEGTQPGFYETEFDGSGMSNGIYFYRIVTDNFTDTKKMMLLK